MRHKNKLNLPDLEILNKSFLYDPETGILRWKAREVRKEFSRTDRGFNTRMAGVEAGCDNGCGYLRILFNGKWYVAHRIVWKIQTGKDPIDEIDHINGVRSDNRFCNLRECNASENQGNQKLRRDNTTKLKGVHCRNGLFYAQVRKNKEIRFKSRHSTAEEAHIAYCEAAKIFHGEFFRQS